MKLLVKHLDCKYSKPEYVATTCYCSPNDLNTNLKYQNKISEENK